MCILQTTIIIMIDVNLVCKGHSSEQRVSRVANTANTSSSPSFSSSPTQRGEEPGHEEMMQGTEMRKCN